MYQLKMYRIVAECAVYVFLGHRYARGARLGTNVGFCSTLSAGTSHTCAVSVLGQVRCWEAGSYGQLGYGNKNSVGSTEVSLPDSVGDVNVSAAAERVVQISAGTGRTCALLSHGKVRCWGFGEDGQLGYGNAKNVGDFSSNTPAMFGDVLVSEQRYLG